MFLVDAYEYLSDALIKKNTAWYKQPFFIVGVILTGVAISAYIYYLRKRAHRLEVKIETTKTKAKQKRHEAKQADRKEELKRLESISKKRQEEVARARRKLGQIKARHRNLESSIEKANSLSEIIDLTSQVNESGSS